MSDNVVQFPRKPVRDLLNQTTVEGVEEAIRVKKMAYVSEVVSTEMRTVYDRLSSFHGINTTHPGLVRDLAFLSGAMQSLVMRYYGMHNPLQDMADSLIPQEISDALVQNVTQEDETDDPTPPMRFA